MTILMHRWSDSRICVICSICVICGGCTTGGPYRLRGPAPQDQTEAFLCVVAVINQLGYLVQRSDRTVGVVEGRGTRRRPRSQGGSAYYDEIAVSIAHEPAGDFLLVTADDRGHGEEILRRCGRSTPGPDGVNWSIPAPAAR